MTTNTDPVAEAEQVVRDALEADAAPVLDALDLQLKMSYVALTQAALVAQKAMVALYEAAAVHGAVQAAAARQVAALGLHPGQRLDGTVHQTGAEGPALTLHGTQWQPVDPAQILTATASYAINEAPTRPAAAPRVVVCVRPDDERPVWIERQAG
jgi:hypothetical protein